VNDPCFLTAFYYSLRNTLVANDLEQGSRIAYGQTRHRVVTLQGQIIETSGTMSGGGNPQRGRMGNKLSSTDSETTHTVESLKRMVDKVKEYENELRTLINQKLELEPEVYELKTKIEEAKQNLNKWRMETDSLKEQIKNLKTIEADCMKRLSELTPDPAKQAKLVKTLDEFKDKYEKADRLAAKLRNENDDLHNKILEISKGILDEPKAKLNEIEKKINECNTSLTSLSVEIKTSRRNLVNSEKKLASLKEDFETNQTLITTNEKRLVEMDEEGKEIVEKHNEGNFK
jgi:structural maintenance of chromosome 4